MGVANFRRSTAQRLRRHGLAARRDGDVQPAEIDAGVLHAQVFHHGHRYEAERREVAVVFEQADGFRSPGRDLVEATQEALIGEGPVSQLLELRSPRVAEEFVIAEQVLRGRRVVLRLPVSLVVLEIGFAGVGEVVGGEGGVAVQLHQVVGIGEGLVDVFVVVVAAIATVTAVAASGGLFVLIVRVVAVSGLVGIGLIVLGLLLLLLVWVLLIGVVLKGVLIVVAAVIAPAASAAIVEGPSVVIAHPIPLRRIVSHK
jgi:hypothetical protein